MNPYTEQLLALAQQIPDSVAEENLPQLEEAATGFQHLLRQVQEDAARYPINILYYYRRLKHIESALYEAKYGRDQKQRDAAFKKAKKELAGGIEDLSGLVEKKL